MRTGSYQPAAEQIRRIGSTRPGKPLLPYHRTRCGLVPGLVLSTRSSPKLRLGKGLVLSPKVSPGLVRISPRRTIDWLLSRDDDHGHVADRSRHRFWRDRSATRGGNHERKETGMERRDLESMSTEKLLYLRARALAMLANRNAVVEQRVEALRPRDREVLGHLCKARALTTAQIARLRYGGDEEAKAGGRKLYRRGAVPRVGDRRSGRCQQRGPEQARAGRPPSSSLRSPEAVVGGSIRFPSSTAY